MEVLNLYSGLGGNRKLWEGVKVTAVELDPTVAKFYQDQFPDDTEARYTARIDVRAVGLARSQRKIASGRWN